MRDVVVAVGGGTKAASRQQGQGGVTLAAAAAGSGSGSAASPCAACKLLRRRCAAGCVFAPYFPPGEPHKFANVHKVFGASNVSKLLQVYRTIAASSLNLSSSLPSCHAMTCLALSHEPSIPSVSVYNLCTAFFLCIIALMHTQTQSSYYQFLDLFFLFSSVPIH